MKFVEINKLYVPCLFVLCKRSRVATRSNGNRKSCSKFSSINSINFRKPSIFIDLPSCRHHALVTKHKIDCSNRLYFSPVYTWADIFDLGYDELIYKTICRIISMNTLYECKPYGKNLVK